MEPLVTPELCKSLNEGQVLVSDVGSTIGGITAENRAQYILELIAAAIAGNIQPSSVSLAIKAAGLTADNELAQAIADSIWYSWLQLDDSIEKKDRIKDVTSELVKEKMIERSLLQTTCEVEFMEWMGYILDQAAWHKNEVRVHTKTLYFQKKYNLMREESEGYAKLVTLLNQLGEGRLMADTTAAVFSEIKALIGYFSLDPNRVLSLTIESYAVQPSNDAFLDLIKLYNTGAVDQLLGFQFTVNGDSNGLYTIAARMVRDGIVQLEELLGHLSPSDEALPAVVEATRNEMTKAISKIGIISLTSDADNVKGKELPLPTKRPAHTAAVLDLDPLQFTKYLTAKDPETGRVNQKLKLVAAFIRIGDWDHAVRLMHWLAALGVSDFGIFPDIGSALCTLIEAELPYDTLYPNGLLDANASSTTPVLSNRLLELLQLIGHHLYHNIVVLTKLVRILGAIVKAHTADASSVPQQQVDAAFDALRVNVLPAMSLLPSNVALILEIWNAIAKLPYTQRFCMYADLRENAQKSPLLTAAAKLAETEARRILRRVTAPASKKEARQTMKPLSRMLAKIMHANPLAVAEILIRQVMGMPGMAASIVESLKYLTPLAFDVMTFAIIKQFASPKKKLKDDGVNLEEWFQWLAAFTGVLAKKHSGIEVAALLQYVANQLKGTESLDLLVLKELLTTMTGIQAVFDVSDTQLDALAGSESLINEVIAQGEGRSSDTSLQWGAVKLLAALRTGTRENQLAMPLLVLLAQQQKLITLQPQSNHLKLVAELYDKCHETVIQYIEFLQQCLPLNEYAKLVPSIEDLANEYKLDPEVIFQIHRPLIASIHPPIDTGGDTAMEDKPAGDEVAPTDEEGEIETEDGETVTAAAVPTAYSPEAWSQLEQQAAALAPTGGFKTMSMSLFITFWSLNLYDLVVPEARYESVMTQLKSTARIAREDLETARKEATQQAYSTARRGFFRHNDATQGPRIDVEQVTRDLERSEFIAAKLPGEFKAQQENAKRVAARLEATCKGWCTRDPTDLASARKLAKEFFQHCILPRVLNSPADAIYCVRFIEKAQALNAPAFNIPYILRMALDEFGYLVRCSTARETANIGIFFAELFVMVEPMRDLKYFQENLSGRQTFKCQEAPKAPNGYFTADAFKAFWGMLRLSLMNAFTSCINSKDYMQMKNVLLTLNRMVRVFPVTRQDARILLDTLAPIRDKDPREDLKTLARMYCSAVEMQLRDKNRKLVNTNKEYAGQKPDPRPAAKKAPITAAAPKAAAKPPEKKEPPGPPPGFGKKAPTAAPIVVADKDRPPARAAAASRQADKRDSAKQLRPEAQPFVPVRGDDRQGAAPLTATDGPKRGRPEPLSRDQGPAKRTRRDEERLPISPRGDDRYNDRYQGRNQSPPPGRTRDAGRDSYRREPVNVSREPVRGRGSTQADAGDKRVNGREREPAVTAERRQSRQEDDKPKPAPIEADKKPAAAVAVAKDAKGDGRSSSPDSREKRKSDRKKKHKEKKEHKHKKEKRSRSKKPSREPSPAAEQGREAKRTKREEPPAAAPAPAATELIGIPERLRQRINIPPEAAAAPPPAPEQQQQQPGEASRRGRGRGRFN